MTGSTAPEGYLGTSARITSGPAPELVAAGYALEIADAPLLHRGLTLADLAHLAELVDCGALRPDEAAPLCAALLGLLDSPAAEFPYDPVYGDAYNSRERELERTLGPAAGRLHLGRTRREAGRIAFRLALRDKLLGLHAGVTQFAAAAADQAAAHAATLWADTTYLQPAQPSTFGHYLGSFAEQALRHLDRIEAAYHRADVSPAGRAGPAGPGCRWTGTGSPPGSASPRPARTPGTRCGRLTRSPTRSWRPRRPRRRSASSPATWRSSPARRSATWPCPPRCAGPAC